MFLVNGYTQYIAKNRATLGGDVMIQLIKSCNLLNKHQVDFDEPVMGEISCHSYKFFVDAVYNKPKANKLDLVDVLDNFLSVKILSKTPLKNCGNFNINS